MNRVMMPTLGRNERRLLLSCARVVLDGERDAEIDALLRRPLSWSAVVFFARLHSVGPLVHRHLRDRDNVPRAARRELLKQYQRVGYQNRIFVREHARLMDAFDAASVEVIVPKGLSVLDLAYGDRAGRPLIDLIYLIRPSELEKAVEVLEASDYVERPVRPVQGLYRWSAPQFFFRRNAGDMTVIVLLQPTLVSWPRLHRFDSEGIWAAAGRAKVGGRETRVLSPTDLVLYLCLQADNHGFFNRAAVGSVDPFDLLFADWSNNRLVRFVDIRESIRVNRGTTEWDQVAQRARQSMLDHAVHASLFLTNKLLGATIPSEVIEDLRPSTRPPLRSWLVGGLAGNHGAKATQRLLGSAWRAAGPRRQLDLARVIGLGELALPSRGDLRVLAESSERGELVLRYARSTGEVLVRSGGGFLRAVLGRAGSDLRKADGG